MSTSTAATHQAPTSSDSVPGLVLGLRHDSGWPHFSAWRAASAWQHRRPSRLDGGLVASSLCGLGLQLGLAAEACGPARTAPTTAMTSSTEVISKAKR